MLIGIAALLSFSACATMVWDHPRGTSNFRQDRYACENEAAQFTSAVLPGNVFMLADRIKECLRVKGYYQRPLREGEPTIK